MAEIRLAAYDVLCMSVLYCPVPFQQELQLRLFAALQQLSPEAVLSQARRFYGNIIN
jgi:hypothetical protein